MQMELLGIISVCERLKVFTAMKIEFMVFWVVVLYGVVQEPKKTQILSLSVLT
jgi:hypothetical protein